MHIPFVANCLYLLLYPPISIVNFYRYTYTYNTSFNRLAYP